MKRFGLEVEFVGTKSRVVTELRNAGIEVLDMSSTHAGYSNTAWCVKRDGSVQRGGELVSPPLDFDNPDDRQQVSTAMIAMQRAGAKPDPSAGIHVHIEAKHANGAPMTARELAAVVRFTYKFEDAIYRIASSGWQSLRSGARSYAKPIPEATAQIIMKVHTMDELQNAWSGMDLQGRGTYYGARRRRGGRRPGPVTHAHQSRYTATNLQAFWSKGTVEFRYFNSSVNPVRVQTYIAFCMAIMDDARNGFSRSVKKSYRIGAMKYGEVTEEAVLLRLQQVLTTNSKDTKRCMSKEDWKNFRNILWKGSVPQEDVFRGRCGRVGPYTTSYETEVI